MADCVAESALLFADDVGPFCFYVHDTTNIRLNFDTQTITFCEDTFGPSASLISLDVSDTALWDVVYAELIA